MGFFSCNSEFLGIGFPSRKLAPIRLQNADRRNSTLVHPMLDRGPREGPTVQFTRFSISSWRRHEGDRPQREEKGKPRAQSGGWGQNMRPEKPNHILTSNLCTSFTATEHFTETLNCFAHNDTGLLKLLLIKKSEADIVTLGNQYIRFRLRISFGHPENYMKYVVMFRDIIIDRFTEAVSEAEGGHMTCWCQRCRHCQSTASALCWICRNPEACCMSPCDVLRVLRGSAIPSSTAQQALLFPSLSSC